MQHLAQQLRWGRGAYLEGLHKESLVLRGNTKATPDPSALSSQLPQAVTDEHLLLAYCATGDDDLFRRLVGRHQKPLFSYLRQFLGDGAAAEDVMQATLLKVHQKCGSFDARRQFRPWLYRIARNQAIDQKRRTQFRQAVSLDASVPSSGSQSTWACGDLVEDGQGNPAMQVEQRELEAKIRRAVQQLPQRLRQVVNLVYFCGLRYQEAAKVLSVPVGTVKSRMHSAMTRLRAQIH